MENRSKYIDLVQKYNKDNPNLIKHMIAVEHIMKKLANKFGKNEQLWGVTGLVHDIDYSETSKTPEKHGIVAENILIDAGVNNREMFYAIKSHAKSNNFPRKSLLDKSLYCSDPVSGFIVACALMHPEKSIEKLDEKFLLKRFKEKRFAKGADRNQISQCSEIGFDLSEFLLFAKNAMSGIKEIGL